MKSFSPWRFITCVVVCLLAGPLHAQQEVGRQIGQVAEAVGDVRETRLWDDTESALATGDAVRLRTRIETGRRSLARLLFDQGATVEMLQRDRIEIREEAPAEDAGAITTLVQGLGTSRIFIARVARDDVQVVTRDANLGPKGTGLVVRVDRSRTVVWVLEGRVDVTAVAGGPPVEVAAGQMTVVRRGRRPTAPAPFDPASGATGSDALPPPFDRPPEEHPDPPFFPVPEELPPRRGIDDPQPPRGPPQGPP